MQEACTPSILLHMTCMLIFCLNIDFVFSLSHTQTLLNLNSHCIGPNHLRYCTIISHLGHLQRLFNPNDTCLYQNILIPPHIACYSVFPHLFIRLLNANTLLDLNIPHSGEFTLRTWIVDEPLLPLHIHILLPDTLILVIINQPQF